MTSAEFHSPDGGRFVTPLGKIDAVLPLRLRDCDRSEVLRRSLERFFVDLGTCWVVARDREFDVIRSRIAGGKYEVIPESAIIPELKIYKWIRRIPGWYLQQLIKLAITPKIETKFYLTLDADVICVRDVTASDLVKGEKALTRRYESNIHSEWYLWAERVLGLQRSGFAHGVTPALLNKQAVTNLQDYLSNRVHPTFRLLKNRLRRQSPMGNLLGSWKSYLLRNLPWTEYTLYYTFLEANGLFEKHHFEENRHPISGPSIWRREDFLSWDHRKAFSSGRAFFVVVQSYAATPSEVWGRVAEFLEAPASGVGS